MALASIVVRVEVEAKYTLLWSSFGLLLVFLYALLLPACLPSGFRTESTQPPEDNSDGGWTPETS